MGNTITLELIDGQGRPTSKDVDLVNSITTLAAAQTALDALVADWPLLSGLGITGASVSIKMTVTPVPAQVTSNKDEGARVKLLMEDGGNFNWRIPAPLKDVGGEFVYITGGAVDVANVGVVGWFANYLSAGAARFTKYGQRILAVGGILSGELEEK
jgi:hypothetical protein